MNARQPPSKKFDQKDRRDRPETPPVQFVEPGPHLHRQRDFGIGYGNSSGYGSDLHYGDGHVDPIFRCT